jgi:hypothetical protein
MKKFIARVIERTEAIKWEPLDLTTMMGTNFISAARKP